MAAALSSVLAAIFLTSMKIVVGVLTGSLGILAEAAHSGLDLVAAGVTFFAVRVSSRPADRGHTYGHGKVENLSALFETLLLLVTCAWIIYEAIIRLFFRPMPVEANIWAFLVMAISIVVDFTRSRLLYKVAKKYDSQALEADALHFSTDIWSSLVVIGGLFLVAVADRFNIPWLMKADAVAAMLVAGIVVYVSLQLGRRAVGELLDEVPVTLPAELAHAVDLLEVEEVRSIRVRHSGPDYFVDLTLAVNRTLGSEQSHEIAIKAEKAIQARLPGATVTIHLDPIQSKDEKLTELLNVLAAQYGLGIHHIRRHKVKDQAILTLHLDVDAAMPLVEAHERASRFEAAIHNALPDIQQIWTHLEPISRQFAASSETAIYQDEEVEKLIRCLPEWEGVSCGVEDILLLRET